MNCLECSLSPTMDIPNTAIAGCAYCGAGACLDHARVITLHHHQVGVVPEIRTGERRIVCTTCYAGTALEGDKAGAFTVPASRARAAGEQATAPATARAGR